MKRQRGGVLDMESIPRKHRVFPQLFYDTRDGQMYGSSHLKELLHDEGRTSDETLLQEMEEDIYQQRRSYLIEHVGIQYQGETVTGFNDDAFTDVYRPPTQQRLGFYLSHKLSPETIEHLRPAFDHLQRHPTVEAGKAFLQQALSLRDYVINLVAAEEFLWDMRGKERRPYRHPIPKKATEVFTEAMERMDAFVSEHMKRILRQYETPKDALPTFPTTNGYALLPKGTRLYRGFKQRRGPLNLERGYSYFVMDPATCLIYALPDENFTENERKDQETTEVQAYKDAVGGVVEVETTEDIRLLDLSTAPMVRRLHAEMKAKNAPPSVLEAFTKGWVITPNDTFHRSSAYSADVKVMDWLCKNGYTGYIARQVQGLHDEMVFCNIQHAVRIRRIYGAEDFNMPLCTEPYVSLPLRIIYW